LALAVPLSRFTSRVGGGSAFFVRLHKHAMRYYILQSEEPKGPYTLSQLKNMWSSGAVTGDIQYAPEGMRPNDKSQWPLLAELQSELEPKPQRPIQQRPVVVRPTKSRGIFIILGLFFGCLGVHNFYAGYYAKGAAQLAITILLGWFIIGFVVTAVWALIEICIVTEDADRERMT